MKRPAESAPPHTVRRTDRLPHRSKTSSSSSSLSLLVEPTQLLFPPPHRERAVQNIVLLSNIGKLPCVFKIKALTPERYYTKPNIGVVFPAEAVRVRFILRPQVKDLPANTHDRFRLFVQTVPSSWLVRKPQGMSESKLKELWNELGGDAAPTLILKRDLMCSFSSDFPVPVGAQITVLDPAAVGLDTPSPRGNTGDFASIERGKDSKNREDEDEDEKKKNTNNSNDRQQQKDGKLIQPMGAITDKNSHTMRSRGNSKSSNHPNSENTRMKQTLEKVGDKEKDYTTITTEDSKMNDNSRNGIKKKSKGGSEKVGYSFRLSVVILLMLLAYGAGLWISFIIDNNIKKHSNFSSSPAAPSLGTAPKTV
ncbi:uncharacterized protein TM35_000201380 [Trypanosoma theileri]|uniref:MSP domain-containing protein n=1 Tax=Trypanosoma theileri TaxID=67003 RepID=A0A1X0NU67_9TRYP|nr:uncharacterized protein TM35_000201380 [Trypanosoma theileri]ORC87729.1 hypothetical protein TM35_000201380 [Trypanosoma theileri]